MRVESQSTVKSLGAPTAGCGELAELRLRLQAPITDLETAIAAQCQLDRACCRQLNQLARRQQRELLEQAVAKLKEAAGRRIWSAVVVAVVTAVAKVASAYSGGSCAGAACEGIAAGLSKYNALDLGADGLNADAQRLRLDSDSAGQDAADFGERAREARELQGRLLSRLEEFERTRSRGAEAALRA